LLQQAAISFWLEEWKVDFKRQLQKQILCLFLAGLVCDKLV
jgi:hypothetical protein